jgi:hypothetical protein
VEEDVLGLQLGGVHVPGPPATARR